jgi:hypothetical protein
MTASFNGRSKNPWLRMIIGVVIVLGGLGLVLYQQRWVRSVIEGPTPMTLTELEKIQDPQSLSNPWIALTFNDAIDTGFVMNSSRGGNTTARSKYLLIRVGDRWLISDVPAAFAGNQVVGYLEAWWSPLSREVIDKVKTRFPDREILSYQLNAEYSYRTQCFALLGIAGFIVLVGLFVIGLALSDLRKSSM